VLADIPLLLILAADGISIPSSYTSYLAPITSTKLHQEVTGSAVAGTSVDIKPAEQPYVVMFSAHHILSASGGRQQADRIQECWTFQHPRPDVVVDHAGLPITNHHNARSTHLTFHIPRAGVCHGFAGYFEAVLYRDVGLSIHPERSAGDMLSWFPCFFPLMVSRLSFTSSLVFFLQGYLLSRVSLFLCRTRSTSPPGPSWMCKCGA